MKKGTLLLFVIITFFDLSFASATTIFSDTFEDGSISDWNLTAVSGGNNWTANQTDPFVGGWHAQSIPASTNDPASIMNKSISTVGYQNINISYSRKLKLPTALKTFRMKWFDGTSWTTLESVSNLNDASYANKEFILGSNANNNPNFKIEFECTSGALSDYCRLDEVLISGSLIDPNPPLVTINLPVNNKAYSTSSFNFNVSLNENGSVLYSLNNGITNITMSSTNNQNFNATNSSLGDGTYTFRAYANDTNGNNNFTTSAAFTVDTAKPLVSMTYPQSTSYNVNVSALNYTASDTNLQNCWYSLNNGVTNSTPITCGANFTGLTSSEGSNTGIIYANDSAGNLNFSSITFSKDTILPAIQLVYPQNTTYSTTSLQINFTVSDTNLQSCWYTNNSGTINNSLPNCANVSYTATQGSTTLTVYANDSLNNINSSTVTFFVDSIKPLISFGLGTANNQANTTSTNIYVNVSVTETNEANITFLLHNSTSQVNSSTFTTAQRTINWTGLADGLYTYNVTVFDTAGNSNTTETRTIRVDTAGPTLTIILPETKTYATNTSLPLNYTIVDAGAGLSSCWFNVNNGANTTLSNCQNTTFNVTGISGSHTVFVFVNDTLNNIAIKNVTFSILTEAPAINLIYPTNNSYLSFINNIYLNYSAEPQGEISSCRLWGDFTGTWQLNKTNNSISSINNFFILNLTENNFDWGIICNDTQNRVSNVNYTFTTDITFPSLTLTQPTGTKTSRTSIPLTFSANDLNPTNCVYNVFQGASLAVANTSVNCGAGSSTFDVSSDGDFVLNFYLNDSAGNINSTNSTFSVDTTSSPPAGGGGGGGGGSGSRNTIIITENETEKIKIEPLLLEKPTIKKGTSGTTLLQVTNTGNVFLNNCKLKFSGTIASWFSNDQIKGLAAGEKFFYEISVNVPENGEPGEYSTGIEVSCDEISTNTELKINTYRNNFEGEILDYGRDGNTLTFSYSLTEYSGKDHEIILDYSMTDLNGIVRFEDQIDETLLAKEKKLGNIEFNLPKDSFGEFILKIQFNEGESSIEAEKNIFLPSSARGPLGFVISEENKKRLTWAGYIVVSIAVLFFAGRFIYKHQKNKHLHFHPPKPRRFLKWRKHHYH